MPPSKNTFKFFFAPNSVLLAITTHDTSLIIFEFVWSSVLINVYTDMAGAAVLSADQISEYVNSFRAERSKYTAIKDDLGLFFNKILSRKDVKFHWEARVKSPDSLEVKLRQRNEDYESDDANCKAIKDLVAGRIILPRWSNFPIVEDMIEQHFDVISTTQHPKAPWRKKDTMQQRFRDYDGFHFYFKRKPETVTDGLQEAKIEIQVMSPFMWAYQVD
jgi:ppGpp synthetase/RelA/SpoT-type nucleotidyltranferase